MFKSLIIIMLLVCNWSIAQQYQFQGTMSREQLESYLARSINCDFEHLNSGMQEYNDLINFCARNNIRIIGTNFGTDFTSELAINHGLFDSLYKTIQIFNTSYDKYGYLHPIVGGGIWESVTKDVDSVWMDSTVYNAYHVPIRRFIYDSIKYHSDTSTLQCTPDISNLETQMYFYFLATHFIKCGMEAIHFGEIGLEDTNDIGNYATWNLFSKIRTFASNYNRGLVLLNADTYGLFLGNTSKALFDYNSYPSRITGYYTGYDSTWTSMWDFMESPYGGPGKIDYTPCSPYGKMKGGQSYFGWYADTLPYVVGLDNTLTKQCNCLTLGSCWNVYGFDEISWFCLQTEDYRNKWLCYETKRVKELDRNCFFIMPIRNLFTHYWKYYNGLNGYGYNQEDAIVNILNGTETECNPNDLLDLHEIYSIGNTDSLDLIPYPNPSDEGVNILFHAPIRKKMHIKIVDMLGKTITEWNETTNQGYQVWDTQFIQSGMYWCIGSTGVGPTKTTKIAIIK